MSDAQRPDATEAEPVDAEFEPAPGASAKPMKPKARRGLPWLTIAVVTLFAGAVGGATGWLIGRYAPDPNSISLEDRLTALEAAAQVEPADGAAFGVLEARLEAVETEIIAGELRAQAVEQLVRDVAALRTQVDALPSFAADASTAAGGDRYEQLDAAVADLASRLSLAEAAAETAGAQAEQARAAVQQALSAVAQTGSADPAETANADPIMAAALARADMRLTALETAQQDAAAQLNRMADLNTVVSELQAALSEPQDFSVMNARIDAIEMSLAALQTGSGDETPPRADRAVAFAALSRAAASDEPFPVALADIQRIWPAAPGAASLAPIARTGAPTAEQLAAGFPAAAIRAATGEAQLLFGVIRVERDGETGPTDAIEAALAAEDLAGAVEAARALEGEAAEAASEWVTQAAARLAIETALGRMSGALADHGGERP